MLARSAFSPHYWWAWLCGYGLFVGFGALTALSRHRQSVFVFVIICGVILVAAMLHDARIDAKRYRAFQHLAQTPSLPIRSYNPDTLTLPLRILWRPTRRGIVVIIGMVAGLTIAIVVSMNINSKTPSHVYLSASTWVIALLFAVLLVECAVVLPLRAIDPAFSVWDKGIAAGWYRNLDYSSLLLWRDATFFAVRAKSNGLPTHYEVAGARRIITLGRLRPGSLAAFFFRPPMSFAAYDALMDSLVAYIAYRTKLPLVDLTQM